MLINEKSLKKEKKVGILLFKVDKDKIQNALKEMNQTHSHMKNEVVGVTEKENCYEVLVNTSNDYPFITNKWLNNDFYN